MISPKKLPISCPQCGAEIRGYDWSGVHAHGWDMERARYDCGSRFEWSGKLLVQEQCPKSPAAIALEKRERELDEAVAAALAKCSATREECEQVARRAERGIHEWSYSGPEGMWRFLPRKQRDGEAY